MTSVPLGSSNPGPFRIIPPKQASEQAQTPGHAWIFILFLFVIYLYIQSAFSPPLTHLNFRRSALPLCIPLLCFILPPGCGPPSSRGPPSIRLLDFAVHLALYFHLSLRSVLCDPGCRFPCFHDFVTLLKAISAIGVLGWGVSWWLF